MNPRPSTAAFSLVEVLCAILILGVALVGLTHGISTALVSSKEAEYQTAAALLAAGRIETLRAEGYLVEGTEEGEVGETNPLYRWRQSITGTSIEGLYDVTVEVANAKTGQTIFELRTLLFDPPVSPTEGEQTGTRRDRRRTNQRPR